MSQRVAKAMLQRCPSAKKILPKNLNYLRQCNQCSSVLLAATEEASTSYFYRGVQIRNLRGFSTNSRSRSRSRSASTSTSTSTSTLSSLEKRKWTTMRTHDCGSLGERNAGEIVKLAGWVQSVRRATDSLLFVGLRDSFGVTQVVFDKKEDVDKAFALLTETIIQIEGTVKKRPEETTNLKMKTGSIEVFASDMKILNECVHPLPLTIDRDDLRNKDIVQQTGQIETRLKHRHLDIRGAQMQMNLRLRAAAVLEARNILTKELGFIEVETPVLFKSTPEGAKEFIVPTRNLPAGSCYALTQSPQQYKQILMAGGIDRYFQVAKCFRDESGRADRQPEFTQLDIEMSFVGKEEVKFVTESVLKSLWRAAFQAAKDMDVHKIPVMLEKGYHFFEKYQSSSKISTSSFPSISYETAIETYGSDKPDRRFGLKIANKPLFENRESLEARSIAMPGDWKPSRKQMQKFVDQHSSEIVSIAIIVLGKEEGDWSKMILGKPKSDARQALIDLSTKEKDDFVKTFDANQPGHIIVSVGSSRDEVCTSLGRARLELGEDLNLIQNDAFDIFWVEGFPLFERDEENDRLQSVHHPFTLPHPQDTNIVKDFVKESQEQGELLKVRGQHYDLVCNGMELGGGSVRIHSESLQRKVFQDILELSETQVEEYFGHLLGALKTGCPPHAGIALGMDRLLSTMCDSPSLMNVLAFPKSNTGKELFSGAPTVVDDQVLKDYHLKKHY